MLRGTFCTQELLKLHSPFILPFIKFPMQKISLDTVSSSGFLPLTNFINKSLPHWYILEQKFQKSLYIFSLYSFPCSGELGSTVKINQGSLDSLSQESYKIEQPFLYPDEKPKIKRKFFMEKIVLCLSQWVKRRKSISYWGRGRGYVETTLPTARPALTFLIYSSKFMKCLLCESCTTNQGDVVNHVGRPAGVWKSDEEKWVH